MIHVLRKGSLQCLSWNYFRKNISLASLSFMSPPGVQVEAEYSFPLVEVCLGIVIIFPIM